ncbi:PhoX family phosphatase [Palleronia sp. LCG004]|uniref:PhoX family protein n=1 Tax=Palleronia sp. LCG004 TaxID=3079304 RepID=UPI002942D0C4|nr:PhoX family phosphatase [Palleronia sp. LCG004]WOI55633.1 PhoX family phosphatase [Palleronia sp. LCG004]
MKDLKATSHLSWDEWDELNDPRPEQTDFDAVVASAMSRRGFLGGVLAVGSGAAVMGLGPRAAQAQTAAGRFAFTPIPIQTDTTVHVPEGYSWRPVAKWGQPLFSGVEEMSADRGVSLEASDKVFGENTDGMEAFVHDGHQLIAVNHEYVNPEINLPHIEGGIPTNADEVRILQNMQGVTVMEIAEGAEGWDIVLDSPYNRRIHHNTPMRISGPAAGHDLLRTEADPEGREALGTLNNCGSGKTPWGTYLTCEENFNGYFGSTDAELEANLPTDYGRYGISAQGRYNYEAFDERFDVSKTPNEPRRFGYVVEIDPADPESMPVKRTALGRFKHENAASVIAPDGRVVVYLGDDERGEFLYKFVSDASYDEGGDTSTLLDEGQLYVAKFNDDMTGEWIALTPEATGMADDAEIAIFTRMAGSAVGATTMDRPEWVAVNPVAVEAYCALTNNSNRGVAPNAGGDETAVGGPNPRSENEFGQIVRWFPANEDHADTQFRWDLYVMAGNPTVHDDAYAGSDNLRTAEESETGVGNLFNSPDGMSFDTTGILWIQTDGDDTNEGDFQGMGNNQMLAGDPETGRIERFLTGPNGSEVTGLTWSDDLRTMFVGIQHPSAPFPDGEGMLPRSAVIQVVRDDKAQIG